MRARLSSCRDRSTSPHPYREASAPPSGNVESAVENSFVGVQLFLVVWAFLRIVVDISCVTVDMEGLAAFALCALLAPNLACDLKARLLRRIG